MAISEQAEAKMIMARNARNKQNPKVPHLINIKDARLLPNVPALAGRPAEVVNGKNIPAKPGHRDYRPYTGKVNASLDERMKWIETNGSSYVSAAGPRAVSLANVEPFDVGTATIDELIAFAAEEYQYDIPKGMGLKATRTEVIKLAKAAHAVIGDELLG